MSTVATDPATSPQQPPRRSIITEIEQSENGQLWLFAVTLFASALLLFAVQPMFAKMALPKLGGSPSVWAVSLCFYQAMLLAGYCYAHALNKYLTPSSAVLAHMVLLVTTLLALPIGLPARLGEPPQGDAYGWLIGVLALGVGLPFFAVAATAPLLQSWFSRTGHPSAADPYFLYRASNLGSLLALLAYPLVIEPLSGAQAQARTWSFGFMLLAVLIALAGLIMIAMRTHAATDAIEPAASFTTPDADSAPSTHARVLWVLLAAIPSGLMVAVTTFITTDVASAPFLWVIPLALFLLTFIVTFKPVISRHFWLTSYALPVLVMLSLLGSYRMIFALAAFYVAALVCHRELYMRRPDRRYLTAFYLWMSVGGAIGGVFAALVAPQLFISTGEYNVLMIAALFAVPGLLFGAQQALDLKRIAGMTCLALAAFCFHSLVGDLGGASMQVRVTIAVLCAIPITLILTKGWAEQRVIFMLGVALVILIIPEGFRSIYAERSFFGTVRVLETSDGQHRFMLHGTTLHGQRRVRTAAGEPVAAPVPGSYYHRLTPMARGFDVVRKVKATEAGGRTNILAGIVGLGTGSLACYAQAGDAFRFYEIDPAVVKIATTPKYFDFLSTCTPRAPIVVGDARLTLAKEPEEVFDYLVIDAFSSDSVPAHLLTVEALKLYLGKLSESGLIALHVSNRYMDLIGSVAGTVGAVPGAQAAVVRFAAPKDEPDAARSHVVFIARTSKVLDEILTWPDAEGMPRIGARPWTDDYSNVLSAIIRHNWP